MDDQMIVTVTGVRLTGPTMGLRWSAETGKLQQAWLETTPGVHERIIWRDVPVGKEGDG